MEVLDADRMQRADRYAIETMKIPALVLMENAGRLSAEVVIEKFDLERHERVLVLAGPGNNGGDGFVCARHLARAGMDVDVWLIGKTRAQLSADAQAMADAWIGSDGPIVEISDSETWAEHQDELFDFDLVVDALFGTGLSRPLEGLQAEVVAALNATGTDVAAIDIPSGLDASDPTTSIGGVQAAVTVAFARPKPAHVLQPTESACGKVVVVDIGIPDRAIASVTPDLFWTTLDDVALRMPVRPVDSHKGTAGRVTIVGGSPSMPGAPALAGMGALVSGAGLVTVAGSGSGHELASELIRQPLPCTEAGLDPAAVKILLDANQITDVFAVGPGLGESDSSRQVVRELLSEASTPIVLDADGLNAFASAEQRESLAQHRGPLVITPHPGEAARLADCETSDIQSDRLGHARALARSLTCVCVLKGHRSLIAAPDGRTWINSTGNPGMATAGMGDVLTGMIAALIGQGLDPFDAALAGTWLHGRAADLALENGESELSLRASSLFETLPLAINEVLAPPTEDDEEAPS